MTVVADDLKTCPYCAESIKAAAIVCKHCGRDQPGTGSSGQPAKASAPSLAPLPPIEHLPEGGTTGTATFVRVLVLLLGTPLLAAIGSGTNGIALVATVLFFGFSFALYLLPVYEAWKREHPNLTGVVLLNLLLGWTVLGWIGALIWAVSRGRTAR